MQNTTPHSEQFKRQRRFMTALPLLTLPFLLFAFWALGGGKPSPVNVETSKGVNLSLPSPELEKQDAGKLEIYKEAERKALIRKEQLRMDPYAEYLEKEPVAEHEGIKAPIAIEKPGISSGLEETEQKVQKKLEALQMAVSQEPEPTLSAAAETNRAEADISLEEDLQQLERMMHTMASPATEDPEMEQIEGMLDKILDVQHPERVRERLENAAEERKGKTFSVQISPGQRKKTESANTRSGYSIPVHTETNGFYGLEDHGSAGIAEMRPAIPAIIHEDQTLVSGATVKMELMQEVFVNGMPVPKGTLVFGTCAVNGERLNIRVDAIRKGHLILPVNLTVYDMDALPGIRVPGAISRKAAKDGAGDAIQSMRLMPSLDPSLEMQAAGAGIEAAKGLFSKKTKLVKVTVKAGHPLLLLDESSQNQ